MKCLFNGMLVVALALVLAGCGGTCGKFGPPGCKQPKPGPAVVGVVGKVVLSSPLTYTPSVRVTLGGVPVSDAVVTMNGQALAYNSVTQQYEGSAVTPDAAGKFNLSAATNGSTYTASASALTSVPVITVPAPFNAASGNTISWTPPGGMTGGMLYTLDILEIKPNSAGATLVYPWSTAATYAIIPPNTTAAGKGYIMTLSAMPLSAYQAGSAGVATLSVGADSSINFTAQ